MLFLCPLAFLASTGILPAAEIQLASVATDATQGNQASTYSALNADGRFVVFMSDADNLTPGDTNQVSDVFVRDRQTQTTERVSVSSGGAQGDGPSGFGGGAGHIYLGISGDGRLVAFESAASNLVPGDTNNLTDVFVHDRETGATERISLTDGNAQITGFSTTPAISANGRFVAFVTASSAVAGDTNGSFDVFVRDRVSGTTERVSVASGNVQATGFSHRPSVNADGRFVAFDSRASNLVAGDTNDAFDVFVHDRQSGTTERVSVATDQTQANGNSFRPDISGDGRFVIFQSEASNLVPGDANGTDDVFVHDRQTGATVRVSLGH